MEGGRLVEPLITLGIGVIGVVSIVYSLLFGVVQWSASTFTPRLNLFRGDPLVWRTFAFALGVFVFCNVAGLASSNKPQVSVVVPGAAILGVLTTIALIRGVQTRAFLSLQLAYVLETVTAQGRAVIDDLYPVRFSDRGRRTRRARAVAARAPPGHLDRAVGGGAADGIGSPGRGRCAGRCRGGVPRRCR